MRNRNIFETTKQLKPSLKDSEKRKIEGDYEKEEKEEEKFSIESSLGNADCWLKNRSNSFRNQCL